MFTKKISVQLLDFMFRSLSAILLIITVLSGGGCLHRLTTRPITPNIVHSREITREASTAMEMRQWSEARKKLETAVKLNPKDADIRRNYSEVLWQMDKKSESLEQLNAAIKIRENENNPDGSLQILLAEKLLQLNNIQAAEKAASRATDLLPKDYRGWVLHGRTQSAQGYGCQIQGKVEQANGFYHRASLDYYRGLALVPSGSGQNREFLAELATVQMRMQQPQRALSSWQNLERLYMTEPAPIDVIYGKAETYATLKRWDDAASTYRVALEREPGNPVHYLRVAQMLASSERFMEASSMLAKARELAPSRPEIPAILQQIEIAQTDRQRNL